jgi:hypothetical protein
MECQARSRQVVRVTSAGNVGYLYFADGQIFHAQTQRAFGEPAALDILQWSDGSFEPCERPWPPAPSIRGSYEALLLQVAQLRDERRASNLVTFPGRGEPPAPDEVVDVDVIAEEDQPDDRSGAMSIATATEFTGDFPVALRLSGSGAVVKNKGASEELADAVAYATRLVELVGDLLGAGRFVAMECSFKEGQGRCILFTESNGDTLALRPAPTANLAPLREKLGL